MRMETTVKYRFVDVEGTPYLVRINRVLEF